MSDEVTQQTFSWDALQRASVPTITFEQKRCPNEFPQDLSRPVSIAVIGEAPGEDEETYGRPFIGASGQFLTNLLNQRGVVRKEIFVGNVVQQRPAGNNFRLFDWNGPIVQDGIAQLSADITKVNPTIVLLLGNAALHLAKAGNVKPPFIRGKQTYPYLISNWRGSLFRSTVSGPFIGRKCIATYHPAYVLRDYSAKPLLDFDLNRCVEEARSTELILPRRELRTNLSASEICYILDNWPSMVPCSVDLEGGLPNWAVNDNVRKNSKKRRHIGWRCVALSARPSKALGIGWWKFNEEDHARILLSFAKLMARHDVPKVLQNGLYDIFVLHFGYSIHVANFHDDTMLKSWEIYSELPRSLSVQGSVWTKEPFWKDEEMYETNGENLVLGCCKDTAVTIEINEAQDKALDGDATGKARIHYRKMVEMARGPFLYMELRGIRYDAENAKRMWTEEKASINVIRERLATAAGYDLCGEKGSLSNTKLKRLLYEDKKYPPQYKKENGRLTTDLTTDVEALLTIARGRETDTLLRDILAHRHHEGVLETLEIKADFDGRIRSGYSLDAETGRVKCYTSPTGAGTNLQTIQSKLRVNFVADPGYEIGQCDLEGADGWTVAAHLANLGAPALLEDYLAGMKPAKILALLYYFGMDVNLLDQKSLKFHHDNTFPIIKSDNKWLYLGCKRVQHGSSYLMGIITMLWNILHDSYKESGTPIYMEASAARSLQGAFFRRYQLDLWHNWAKTILVSKGELTSASGNTRVFFGRRFGKELHDTLKEFLAHEPQNNTTWATNLAVLKLWNDPENRNRDGSLVIQPLHQVHDALVIQWPIWCREWAKRKMRTYFDNTLVIANRDIKIPFDGNYGPNWGTTPNKI